jgi:hypothetical protein
VDAVDPPRQGAAFLGANLILVEIELERDFHDETDEAFRSRHIEAGAHERLSKRGSEFLEQRGGAGKRLHVPDGRSPESFEFRCRAAAGCRLGVAALGHVQHSRILQEFRSERLHLGNHPQQGGGADPHSEHQMVAAASVRLQRCVDGLALDAGDQHR